ncbi:MAG TPA: hypothetical protein PL051_02575 [Candidatus Saccharibacteria bacterium]|nr:hypothetical protein [Candidatus Saccharibacteria bacterium]
MYSFGPLPRQRRSGRHLGTHQKIDRVARRHIAHFTVPRLRFPSSTDILHFEGSRGPDGVKLKSPGKDEPWHFIDPDQPHEGELLEAIHNHSINLTAALRAGDTTRASFEAAWLAHAVTDGLTPAHHEPYKDQIMHMKRPVGNQPQKVRNKMVMTGESKREALKNNWQYWGAKGIMTTHTLFEGGIASATKPFRFNSGLPSEHDFEHLQEDGFETIYIRLLKEIAALDMYEQFKRTGWTNELARLTNHELLPRIVMAVTLAWYDAYQKALSEEKS